MPRFTILDDPQPSWPTLAWVAQMAVGSGDDQVQVHLRRGLGVEVGDAWFGEAIWSGDFGEGRVDEADQVFGSACRLHPQKLVFVPSRTTLDRLHHVIAGGQAFVSNSLPGIIATAGLSPDPSYPFYFRDIDSSIRGPWLAKPTIPMVNGNVHLTAVDHLEWDGASFERVKKPSGDPAFECYEDYRRFITDAMERLTRNMADPRRQYSLTLLGTLSNGYDSTFATALGAAHGARRSLSFVEPDPDSEANLRRVANSLGVEPVIYERYAFREHPFPEVPFLAAGTYGYEMQFKGVEQHLSGSVLLTGYYGDRVWGLRQPLLPPYARKSQSGLSLTEFRLHAGFIHLPVPFLGCTRLPDLRQIGLSEEMAPWRLDNDYDRPIARRLIEDAGVPRSAFGYKKLVSSVAPRSRRSFTQASDADLRAYLARQSWQGPFTPLQQAGVINRVRDAMDATGGALAKVTAKQAKSLAWLDKFGRRLRQYGREGYLFKYSFVWSVDRIRARYELDATTERPPLATSAAIREASSNDSVGAHDNAHDMARGSRTV